MTVPDFTARNAGPPVSRLLLTVFCLLLPALSLRAARGFYKVQEVKPHVFVWVAEDIRDQQGDPRFNRAGTVGFIITREGVVVVDTSNSPFHAREILYEIRKRTELPVRYVINTCAAADCMLGNEVFVDQQATILASTQAAAEMRQYQRELATRLEGDYQLPARMRGIHPTLPTQTFDGEMHVPLGGQEIMLRNNLGADALAADAVVYLPGEKVLFLGELFEDGFVPRIGAKNVRQWIEILRQVETWDVDVYVPRRGSPGNKQDVANFRSFLEWLLQEVASCLQEGKSADEIKNELTPLDNFPRGGHDLIPHAIEAVYTQLAETPAVAPMPSTDQR